MITKHAAESALSRARSLAADGAGLTSAMRQERAALLRSIEAELSSLEAHAVALRIAARTGDRDAAAKVVAMAESQGDLINARAALSAQGN